MTVSGPIDLPQPYKPRLHDTVTVLDPRDLRSPSPRYPGRWQVIKVNQRTCRLDGLDGQRGPLMADKLLLVKVEGDQGTTHTPAGSAVTVDLPIGQPADLTLPFEIASLVVWKDAPAKAGGKVFVVMMDEGGPAVRRLILLGGDKNRPGRYWRNVPRRLLEHIEPADIGEHI